MTNETDLDDILGIGKPTTPPTPSQQIDMIAKKLIELRAIKKDVSSQISMLEDTIASKVNAEPGEFIVAGEQLDFFVTRSEVWSSDSRAIEAKLPTVPVPDFIKVKYSIDKKKFKTLPLSDQQEYLHALTRKPGKAKIQVAEKAKV